MIGICDSGVGGLTLLKDLHKRYPHTDIIYYGDEANMPYGDRSKEELKAIFAGIKAYFKARGCQDIVVACNTLCSAIDFNDDEIVIHDIIGKTIARLNVPKDKKVLVFATPFTIKSGRYQKGLEKRGYQSIGVALKSLAKDIEEGLPKQVVKAKLYQVFEMTDAKDIGAIILGCTHYPIYKDLFYEYYNVPVFDSLGLDFGIEDSDEKGEISLHMERSDKLERFLKRYIGVDYRYEDHLGK